MKSTACLKFSIVIAVNITLMKRPIVIVLDNIRSALNVGSILRSSDSLGASEVWCCGITPYPKLVDDARLPHIAERAQRQIEKSSLGAEKTVKIKRFETTVEAINKLKSQGFTVYAIEQSDDSKPIRLMTTRAKTALILGNEVDGIPNEILELSDSIYEIPQMGVKESLNVASAAAISLYQLQIKA